MLKKRHADRVLEAVRSPTQAAMSMLVASWRRSLVRHKLDPAKPLKSDFVSESELKILRESDAPLLRVSHSTLDRLFRSVQMAGCCVALTNSKGVILEQRLTSYDQIDFTNMGLANGRSWGEGHVGTNAIGTCLYEGKAVTIYRDQHFLETNAQISCMSAPIYDPFGRLVGALDISNCRSDFTPVMADMALALVLDAAQQIEISFFHHQFSSGRIICVLEDMQSGPAMLAIDQDNIVIGATRTARKHLQIDDKILSQGRSLDQFLGHKTDPSFLGAERAVLRQALASCSGNASNAAKQLGIGRATFYRRMARAGLKGC